MGKTIPCKMIHPYYTPFYTKFQAILAKTTIFVNYANFLCQHFYVDFETNAVDHFTIFNYFSNI